MPVSSVLMGSRPAIGATTIGVTANAVAENLSWAEMDGYVYHPTGALSVVTVLQTLLNTHSQLADVLVFITQSGRIRMTSSVAFAITSWGSDTTLRDFLGEGGTLTSSTAHVLDTVSPYIWIPGKRDSSMARLESNGVLVTDTHAGRSAPGRVVATRNNTWRRNAFSWQYVDVSRVETVPDSNGTWAVWWRDVGSLYRRFNVYRDVTYDDAETTVAMSFGGTRLPTSDTYIMRAEDGAIERPHDRQIQYLERYCSVDLQVETAAEYS